MSKKRKNDEIRAENDEKSIEITQKDAKSDGIRLKEIWSNGITFDKTGRAMGYLAVGHKGITSLVLQNGSVEVKVCGGLTYFMPWHCVTAYRVDS